MLVQKQTARGGAQERVSLADNMAVSRDQTIGGSG
jgi:hypothetical protein